MEVPGTVVDEVEFLPGFLRVQEPGKKVCYRTPFPRRALRNTRNVEKYLMKEHNEGRLLNIKPYMFTFARMRSPSESEPLPKSAESTLLEERLPKKEFMVQQMTPNPKVKLDHRAEMSKVATALDQEFVELSVCELDTRVKLIFLCGNFCLLTLSLRYFCMQVQFLKSTAQKLTKISVESCYAYRVDFIF